MITHQSILEAMEAILKDKLMVKIEKPLTFESNFVKDGIEIDSIMSLEFIVELEVNYEIEIDENELNNNLFSNLGQFVHFIYDKIQQKESLNCAAK
jgi:acyl carrier protein